MRYAWVPTIVALMTLAACSSGGFGRSNDQVFAPGVAGASDIDGLLVGHRLMSAGEYELALKGYTRAASQQGLNVDTLSALGWADWVKQNGCCAMRLNKTPVSQLLGTTWASF